MPFKGTIDVVDRLGTFAKHPKVRAQIGADPAKWPWVPFPYFGDLTLCLEDSRGPYVIDWPVKDKYEDFRRRGPKKSRARPDEDDPGVVARTKLQEIYFSDAGIRSKQVVGRSIDFHLRCNLRELFLDDSYRLSVDAATCLELIDEWNQTVGADVPAYLTAYRLAKSFKLQPREVTAMLKQGIWTRQIRVNLFQPVDMDQPLHPEVEDVLVKYADWFTR